VVDTSLYDEDSQKAEDLFEEWLLEKKNKTRSPIDRAIFKQKVVVAMKDAYEQAARARRIFTTKQDLWMNRIIDVGLS
jgi:hypothetical protein